MHVSQMFYEKNFLASLEVFPPKNDLDITAAIPVMDELSTLKPDFISVTCGAGGTIQSDNTIDLCSYLKGRYDIEPVMHLTCLTLTKEQVNQRLEQLKARNISNVLALRGDRPLVETAPVNDYTYAKELISEVYGEGFCVGGTCYPEGHIDCDDIDKEVEYTKQKIDAGAFFLISQLSFDSSIFLKYLDKLQKSGIKSPVCAGVMPILSKEQVERMIYMCGVSLPGKIIRILNKYQDDSISLEKAGIEYACNQINELKAAGVNGVHIYTMNKPHIAKALFEAAKND